MRGFMTACTTGTRRRSVSPWGRRSARWPPRSTCGARLLLSVRKTRCPREPINMNTVEGIGYLAASLVLATFCMKSMDALRLAAIASNVAFIAYGYFGHLAPVLPEYDRAFAHVTRCFMPFVLCAARVAPGMRVLDIAAGTGLSAEAALSAVGPTGHVTAADVSPAMAERARERLGEARNASVLVEDAQALSFSDESFDAVVCNLGLMFFPQPAEFRRVLRPSGRAAVSVNTVPERSYNHQINLILTRYVPGLAEAVTRTFSLGEASRLEELFREGGFSQIETRTVKHTFVLPSFDAYYGPFERGGASTGQALATLPDSIRHAVREEMRRSLGDDGGPVNIEAEYRIASGRR